MQWLCIHLTTNRKGLCSVFKCVFLLVFFFFSSFWLQREKLTTLPANAWSSKIKTNTTHPSTGWSSASPTGTSSVRWVYWGVCVCEREVHGPIVVRFRTRTLHEPPDVGSVTSYTWCRGKRDCNSHIRLGVYSRRVSDGRPATPSLTLTCHGQEVLHTVTEGACRTRCPTRRENTKTNRHARLFFGVLWGIRDGNFSRDDFLSKPRAEFM